MNRLKNNTDNTLAAAITAAIPGLEIKYRNIFDLVTTLDRVAALAALRSAASSLQFSLFSTADWILREQEKKERLEAFNLTDLDQRNAQDEADRSLAEMQGGIKPHKDDGFVEELAGGHPAGFEVPIDPRQTLQTLLQIYDGVIHAIGRYPNLTAYDLPRPLSQAVDDFILSSGNNQPVNEATMLALRAAGIDDQEFADAGMQAGAKRMARMKDRKPALLRVIEEQGTNPNLDAFLSLPLHKQLRMAAGMWKGVFAKRRQMVTYIAASGKTDDLSDVLLLKNGLATLQAWCDDFESEHSVLLGELIEAGVNVSGMGDAIEWSRRKRN